MGITNSPQEEIIRQLSERSLAAPFVFVPDNTQVGNDEPADLVWACNNCIIVMYMQGKEVHLDDGKNIRARQKAINHNLAQAKRWIRAWKNGKYLMGTNGFHTFCLKYDPNCYLIVLSIIHCGNPVAIFHEEEANKLGVFCCATLPQSAIQALASVGGTSLDLLAIIDEVRKHSKGNVLSEAMVSAIIASYARACWDSSNLGEFWPNYQVDDRFHEASYAILTARRRKALEGSGEATPNWIGMADLNDVFNDIFLAEFFCVTKHVAFAIRTTQDNDKTIDTMFSNLRLNMYDFGLCIGSGMSQDALNHVARIWKQEIDSGKMRYGPIVVFDSQSRNLEIYLGKRTEVSQTEQFLRKWPTS